MKNIIEHSGEKNVQLVLNLKFFYKYLKYSTVKIIKKILRYIVL